MTRDSKTIFDPTVIDAMIPNEAVPDPSVDWLADAKLTPEEREKWDLARSHMVSAHKMISELQKRIKVLEQLPMDDQPTVLTRPEFNREVARMLAFNERYGGVSSVVYLNLEEMNNITARYGKSVTNAAIRETSNILMKHVRGSDIVGRLATDEFGILLGQCDNTNAWKKAEQITTLLHAALAEIQGVTLKIKICFGAYTFQPQQDIASGLKQAAQLMTRIEGSY